MKKINLHQYYFTKFFFTTLLFALVGFALHAQNRVTDSTVTCIAFWKKGEERKLKITQTKSNNREEERKNDAAMSYIARVTIIDSFADGYKIKWTFQQPELQRAGKVQGADGVPFFDGMEFIFLTSETGTFQSLENWEEVRDRYRNLMLLSVRDTSSPEMKDILQKVNIMFKTRENVEGVLIKEIQIYHSLYGLEFSRSPVRAETTLPNAFAEQELPAITTINVSFSPVSKEYYSVGVDVSLDKKSTGNALLEIFKKMGVPQNVQDAQLKQITESLEITDRSEYQVNLSDGWIRQASMIRTTQSGSLKQTHRYLIELLD